jgi:hypothetical protein
VATIGIDPAKVTLTIDGVPIDFSAAGSDLTMRALGSALGSVPLGNVSFGLGGSPTDAEDWHREVARLQQGLRYNAVFISPSEPCTPKWWPRVEDAERILAFVAAGGWTFLDLLLEVSGLDGREWGSFINDYIDDSYDSNPLADHGLSETADLAHRIIRRAKAERRIHWCPHTQRYEAFPAWRHRSLPSRHPWPWPQHASGRR